MTTIRSLMQQPVLTVAASDSVEQVSRRMRDASVGAVLVMQGDEMIGLFSERDLLTRMVAERLDPIETRVEEVATRDVISVPVDATLRHCAETLRERGIRHLPVLENGRPVGLVSARDFFDAIAGEFETLIEQTRYDEQLEQNIDPYDHLGGSYGR